MSAIIIQCIQTVERSS